MITVVVKRAGKAPVVEFIEPTLEASQEIVGGFVEMVDGGSVGLYGIDLWCNEEGKLQGLLPNFGLKRPGGRFPFDIVAGDAFFAAHDGDGGMASLTETQVANVLGYLARNGGES